MNNIDLHWVILASFIAGASPGPATLAIAGTSMANGRKYGAALAAGVCTGSLIWSLTAAFGLSAVIFANVWILEVIRYAGAVYLIYLGLRSAISAFSAKHTSPHMRTYTSTKHAYVKGVLLHLTNPKAILYFGSLYAIVIPQDVSTEQMAIIVSALFCTGIVVFIGYALIFSSKPMVRTYQKMRRWFEAAFAAAFIAAGLKIITARLS